MHREVRLNSKCHVSTSTGLSTRAVKCMQRTLAQTHLLKQTDAKWQFSTNWILLGTCPMTVSLLWQHVRSSDGRAILSVVSLPVQRGRLHTWATGEAYSSQGWLIKACTQDFHHGSLHGCEPEFQVGHIKRHVQEMEPLVVEGIYHLNIYHYRKISQSDICIGYRVFSICAERLGLYEICMTRSVEHADRDMQFLPIVHILDIAAFDSHCSSLPILHKTAVHFNFSDHLNTYNKYCVIPYSLDTGDLWGTSRLVFSPSCNLRVYMGHNIPVQEQSKH